MGVALVVGAAAQAEPLWQEAKTRAARGPRSKLTTVAKKSLGAVVSITTLQSTQSESETSPVEPQKGLGAGFFIHRDGYILTSQHVVDGASEILVGVLEPGGRTTEYPAIVVGQDAQTDFALLKIDAPHKVPVLQLSSANAVDIADWVVVIGNPFGLGHSVTIGVVSYKGRQDVTPAGRSGYFDYLQTDASINPGSSGGPILDINGNVVAIANAVNVSGQGIGFGLPIDAAKAILPELKANGSIRRGWMGVLVTDQSNDVVVSQIVAGSPADRAGLQVGDVIDQLDDSRVQKALALRWKVSNSGAGHWVRVHIRRRDKPLSLKVQLQDIPDVEVNGATVAGSPQEPAPRPAGDH